LDYHFDNSFTPESLRIRWQFSSTAHSTFIFFFGVPIRLQQGNSTVKGGQETEPRGGIEQVDQFH
jgi:hypothetical protein